MQLSNWVQIHAHILELEQEGLVTRTFRRLDPDRQQAVLTAILDEAVEKGPTSLNIKQVAARAEVSVGSLYQYFNNRDGLLAFSVELCLRFMTDEFNRYRPILTALPLCDGLAAYLTGGIEWSKAQVGLVQLFARAAYQGDTGLSQQFVRPIATTLREMVHNMLVAAVERGELRTDVDLDAATRVVHALTIAIGDSYLLPYLNNYTQVVDDEMPFERALEAMLDLILHGIGASRQGE